MTASFESRRRKSAAATHVLVDFPTARTRERAVEIGIPKVPPPSIPQLADKILLENYAPASVMINAKGDIVHIHGRVGNYLEPAPGEPSWNILEMAREGLKLELPAILRRASARQKDVTQEGLHVKVNGTIQIVGAARIVR